MEANKGSNPSSHGYQALSMDADQLSSPLEGKRQCYPSYLSKTCLKLSFFSCSASFWVPQLAQSKSLTSFQLLHCPFSACGSPSPASRAGQKPSCTTVSCLGLLTNFCWLHRLCFRCDVKLQCNPIKPIVPGWPFLFRKISSSEVITPADSEEKLYEAPEDFHANEFQSIISSSLLVFHLPVHKISDFYRKLSFIHHLFPS